jgi:hypothetical protein
VAERAFTPSAKYVHHQHRAGASALRWLTSPRVRSGLVYLLHRLCWASEGGATSRQRGGGNFARGCDRKVICDPDVVH